MSRLPETTKPTCIRLLKRAAATTATITGVTTLKKNTQMLVLRLAISVLSSRTCATLERIWRNSPLVSW